MEEEKNIAPEFKVRDELTEWRKNIKTFDELVDFLEDVKEHYNYDYGVAPAAIAQACLAVGWYLSSEFGITMFQAGGVMWDFILGQTKTGNETGLKLVDYDEMLYPQYRYKFEKTISQETWKNLQEAAKKLIDERDSFAVPTVINH